MKNLFPLLAFTSCLLTLVNFPLNAKIINPSLAINNQGIKTEILISLEPALIEGNLNHNSQKFEDNTYYNIHSFEGQGGDNIAIELISDDFDSYLLVFDAQGQKLGENNDYGNGKNAKVIITLPTNGTYSIYVNTFAPNTTGNYQLTWRTATESELIQAQQNVKKIRAEILLDQGIEQAQISQYQEAIKLWEQALAIFEELEELDGKGRALSNLGIIYWQYGDYETALNYYQQSLDITKEINDRNGEARALGNMGVVYENLGQYTTALNYYQESLTIFEEIGDRGGIAKTLGNLGIIYENLGQFETAINYYQESVKIKEEIGDLIGQANSLMNLGNVHQRLGKYPIATNYYQQALSIFENLGDRNGKARVLNNLGIVYENLGEYERAINYYQESLPIFEQIGDRNSKTRTLNNLGIVYENLGEYERAINYYQQALTIVETIGDLSHKANILINFGNLYQNKKDSSLVINYYQQALNITEEIGDQSKKALILNNLGIIYENNQNDQIAINYYQQALTIFTNIGDRKGEASTLQNLGVIYQKLGQNDLAMTYLQRALPIFKNIGDRTGEANNLRSIAMEEKQQGNLNQALINIELAINIIEELRSKYISPELRQIYFASVQEYYQLYIDLLMELHQKNPHQGYDQKAFNISEKSRARTLLELLTEANTNIKEGVDPHLLEKEQDLAYQLDAIEKQRIEIYNDPSTTDLQKEAINQRQKQLIEESKKLQDEIRRVSPKYADLEYPQPLTLKQVQQEILDEDTLLLQYALGSEKSYLWAVTKDSFTSYELADQNTINQQVYRFRGVLTNARRSTNIVNDQAQLLSNLILGNLAEKISKKRLIIVPDGSLNYIPFNALSLPNQATFVSLIQNHEIVNLPSASTLALIRKEQKNQTKPTKLIALLADPVFSLNDDRLPNEVRRNTPNFTNSNRNINQIDLNWNRLPGTRQEAQAILNFITEDQQITAFDFNANREFINNPELSNYQYIHFATHGFLNTENPELSGIVLSLLDSQGNPQNGFLRLNDLFNIKLGANLVVLSACQTALGTQVRGEGMIGLTRGLMYAGAERLLLSLWNVDDAATAEFMTYFYQLLLEKNLTPAQALRETQLIMQQSPQYNHPYYWSAFILQGEYN